MFHSLFWSRTSLKIRLIIVTALVAAGGLAAVSRSGADPSQVACSAPIDNTFASSTAAEACGFSVSSAPTESPLAGGGDGYVYTIRPGVTATLIHPPADFDALTATDSQLQEYGFPSRPSPSSSEYDSWVSAVSNDIFPTAPQFLVSPPNTQATCTPFTGYSSYQCTRSPATTPNWSGMMDVESSSSYFNQVYVTYTEPTPPESNTCNSDTAAFWAGLGGSGVDELSQDGTEMGLCDVTDGSMWWFELGTDYSIEIPGGSYVTSPGDSVTVDTSYIGADEFIFYIKDNTTDVTFDMEETADSGDYNGATSEFVSERLDIGGYTDLEDFGNLDVSTAYSWGGSPTLEAQMGIWNSNNLEMLNGTHELAYVSTLPSQSQTGVGNFVDKWVASS